MIADLQSGEAVVAEKIDRISRLPLAEAERLIAAIRAKGARLDDALVDPARGRQKIKSDLAGVELDAAKWASCRCWSGRVRRSPSRSAKNPRCWSVLRERPQGMIEEVRMELTAKDVITSLGLHPHPDGD